MRTIETKAVIILTLFAGATSYAEPRSDPAPAAVGEPRPTSKPKPPPAIEPEAITALEKMGSFLRAQQSFAVGVSTQTDYVLEAKQKVTLSAHGELMVRRPDHLRANMASDRKERQFIYDGKTFTINSPRVGFYASLAAPPTITQLADELENKYGLELPMVDLFRWGTDEADVEDITSASFIGQTKLDGVMTDQYAFRQPGLDWQIWIEHGARPVPRKLVLTTTDDPALPEHAIALAWRLDAKHEDAAFAFTPAKDAVKIPVAELVAQVDKHRRAPAANKREPK